MLKENLSSGDDKHFDPEDNSWTRPKQQILDLIEKANLNVVLDKRQLHFPRGMYDVQTFAMKPKS